MLKKIISWIPSLCIMALIFRLSMDTGTESLSLSGTLSGYLHIPDFFIRKAAHITEYMLLTLSLALPLRVSIGLNKKNTALFMAVIAVLYASSDEIHQYFVSGRSGHVRDVLIDSIGIFLGVAFFLILNRKKPV